MTNKTQPEVSPSDIAKLRHLYANLKNGGVRDTAQAKRIADGLLAPIIEKMEQATPKAAPGEPDGFGSAEHWKEKAQYWAGVAHRLRGEALRGEPVDGIVHPPAPQQEAQEPCGWDGAEEWEKLAWHLCAEENGEDACNELIWEGGPIPEPWGDRWLKYEGEARRMIALVRTHVPAPQPAPAPLTDEQIELLMRSIGTTYADDNDERMKNHAGWQRINHRQIARAIESEVRKQDDALILQLVDALEQSQPYVESCANGKRVQWWGAQLDRAQDAINAARARLGENTNK